MLPRWRGRVHVGGGHWNWGTVISLARGRPAAIAFEDVTIIDPEGTEVLHIEPRLGAASRAHRKPTRIIIHDLDIKDARWRYARMKGENKIGFLAAFESIPRKVRKKPVEAHQQRDLDRGRAPRTAIEATFEGSDLGPRAARRARHGRDWGQGEDVHVRGERRRRARRRPPAHPGREERDRAADRSRRGSIASPRPPTIRTASTWTPRASRSAGRASRATAGSRASTASRPRRSSPASTSRCTSTMPPTRSTPSRRTAGWAAACAPGARTRRCACASRSRSTASRLRPRRAASTSPAARSTRATSAST